MTSSRTTRLGAVHVHTAYSHDGRDSIAEVADWARKAGLAFVAITDHAEDLDGAAYERLCAECAEQSRDGLEIIPGLEFRFVGHTGFHLLACGLSRWIEPATPEEFLSLARAHAQLLIAAHPVIWRNSYPPALLRQFDAIEVWNATYNTRYLPDPAAVRTVRALRRDGADTLAIVGLDQHDRRNDRGTRVGIDAGEPAPLMALRRGAFTNIGVTMRFAPTVSWSPLHQAALQVARTAWDAIERVQDRVARARKRTARGKGGA
jgi:hypothetical protein